MLKAIANFFRRLTGTKRCYSLAELAAYIPVGDVHRLAHWIGQSVWYKPDVNPSDEWEPVEVVLKREPKHSDCEEMGNIATHVISLWPDHKARNMVMIHPPQYHKRNHAVSVFWRGDKFGIVDNINVLEYPSCSELKDVIKQHWPTTAYYYFADLSGKPCSSKVFL